MRIWLLLLVALVGQAAGISLSKDDLINGLAFKDVEGVSDECQASYSQFLSTLSNPGELLLPRGRWALKSNFWSIGSPYSCLEVNRSTSDPVIRGKYCIVQPFTLPSDLVNNSIGNFITREGRDEVESREGRPAIQIINNGMWPAPDPRMPPTLSPGQNFWDNFQGILGFPLAKFGLCLPDACSDEDITAALKHLELSLLDENSTYLFLTPSCTSETEPKPDYDTEDIIMLTIFGIFIALNAIGLALDIAMRRKALKSENLGSTPKILASFSPRTNFLGLIKNPAPNANHITCLNGIRVLSMSWVIISHMYQRVFQAQPVNNLLFAALGDFANGFAFRAILNGYSCVDSFFVMSGLLVSYLTLKELDKTKGWLNLPMFYLHRYIRISGMYSLIILFHVSLLRYLPYGPVDLLSNFQITMCKDLWWKNLLYVNNFYVDEGTCLGQCWYLAVDMQLFWAAPAMIWPLWWIHQKKGLKWALGWCLGWIVVFTGVLLTLHLVNDWPASDSTDVHNSDFIFDNYYAPWCRSQPYIVGIATGYLLHITKGKKIKIHWWLNVLLWCAAIGATIGVVYGLDTYDIKRSGEEPSAAARAAYDSLNRLAWGLAISWMIFSCSKGYGGFANRFLSWEAFGPLAKLSFGVYLLHLSVAVFIISYSTFDYAAMHIYVTVLALTVFFWSNILAVVMFVFLEVPIVILEKLMFKGIFATIGKLSSKRSKKEE